MRNFDGKGAIGAAESSKELLLLKTTHRKEVDRVKHEFETKLREGQEVEKKLQKAATKGVLHANAASRRVSRLTRAVGGLD